MKEEVPLSAPAPLRSELSESSKPSETFSNELTSFAPQEPLTMSEPTSGAAAPAPIEPEVTLPPAPAERLAVPRPPRERESAASQEGSVQSYESTGIIAQKLSTTTTIPREEKRYVLDPYREPTS